MDNNCIDCGAVTQFADRTEYCPECGWMIELIELWREGDE